MSIATEIEALNTNLTAAKNAVTAKGGTVDDTGLAGLAAEIATIPSGGGNPLDDPFEPTAYGVVYYYPGTKGWVCECTNMGQPVSTTATIVDETKWLNWREAQGVTGSVTFEYDGNWRFWNYSTGEEIYISDMENEVGIRVENVEWGVMLQVSNKVTLDKTQVKKLVCTANDVALLSFNYSESEIAAPFSNGDYTIGSGILGYDFSNTGDSAYSTFPINFLSYCHIVRLGAFYDHFYTGGYTPAVQLIMSNAKSGFFRYLAYINVYNDNPTSGTIGNITVFGDVPESFMRGITVVGISTGAFVAFSGLTSVGDYAFANTPFYPSIASVASEGVTIGANVDTTNWYNSYQLAPVLTSVGDYSRISGSDFPNLVSCGSDVRIYVPEGTKTLTFGPALTNYSTTHAIFPNRTGYGCVVDLSNTAITRLTVSVVPDAFIKYPSTLTEISWPRALANSYATNDLTTAVTHFVVPDSAMIPTNSSPRDESVRNLEVISLGSRVTNERVVSGGRAAQFPNLRAIYLANDAPSGTAPSDMFVSEYNSPAYLYGVSIYGPYRQNWLNYLTDITATSSTRGRHFVDGGSDTLPQ